MSAKRLEQAAQATKTAFLFPGQGSQKVGMLAELAEQFGGVQETFAEASDAVGFDLWHIAQSGEGLDQTENTQPVLLTTSIAMWRVWLDLGGVAPKYLAGHSLGEYSALVAANSMTLADAVKLVNLRGKLMQSAVPQGQGAMAAILGLEDAKVLELCEQVNAQGRGSVEAANYNAKGQVVVARRESRPHRHTRPFGHRLVARVFWRSHQIRAIPARLRQSLYCRFTIGH